MRFEVDHLVVWVIVVLLAGLTLLVLAPAVADWLDFIVGVPIVIGLAAFALGSRQAPRHSK